MKRTKLITSIAVISILLLVMASTAFALSAPSVSVSDSSAAAGDKVTFTVSMGSGNAAFDGTVSTTNLSNVSISGGTVDGDSFMAMGPVTITGTVTGSVGDKYSVSVVGNVTDGIETEEPYAAVSASGTIPAAEPSTQPSSQPSASAQPTTPVEPAQPSADQPAADEPAADQPAADQPAAPAAAATTTANAKLDKVPKTADETPSVWMFSIMGIAAASVLTVVAVKKARAK